MKLKLFFILTLGISILLGNIGQSVFGCWSSPKNYILSQNTGFDNEIVNINLTGKKLNKTIAIKLTKPGEADILADNLKIISKTQISCSLDLRNKPLGAWYVTIIKKKLFRFTKKDKSTTLNEVFSIMAHPVLKVDNITPNQGFNNESVTVAIHGVNFSRDVSVKLIGNDLTTISGENVNIESDSNLTCSFDLERYPAGKYNLVITGSNGQTAELKEAFSVEAFTPPVPEVKVLTPSVTDLNKNLKAVFFDFDKFNIRDDQLSGLEQDLSVLKANPQLYILIGGHTDERGSWEYNLRLSAKRAESVKT